MGKQNTPKADVWYSPDEIRQYASVKLLQKMSEHIGQQISTMRIAAHGTKEKSELIKLLFEADAAMSNVTYLMEKSLAAHAQSEYEKMYEPEQAGKHTSNE